MRKIVGLAFLIPCSMLMLVGVGASGGGFAPLSAQESSTQGASARRASTLAPSAQGPSAQSPAGLDARAVLTELNSLRVDPSGVYKVSQLNLRRDVIHLSLEDGTLAFLAPLDGRVTGAVFTGTGHAIAIPREAGERRSLARYLGVPMLDLTFSSAYLRFDDSSAGELRRELQGAGVKPENDPEFARRWSSVLDNLNPSQSLRVMMDWLSSNPVPFFYAGLMNNATGPFELLVDGRRPEQVLMGQNRLANGGYFYDVWASFAAAEANPSESSGDSSGGASHASDSSASSGAQGAALRALTEPFAPVDYRVDTTIAPDFSLEGTTDLHLRAARAGERIVALELSGSLAVQSVALVGGPPLVYFQNEDLSRRQALQAGNNALLVVLPAPSRAGQEFRLKVSYRGNIIFDAGNGVKYVGDRGTWYAHIAGDDFVPFDLTFHWPRRYTLVATGTRMESGEQGDTETGRWRSDSPFAIAGFNLGEYKEETVTDGGPSVRMYANSELEEAIAARIRPRTTSILVPGLPRRRRQPAAGGTDPLPPMPPSPADVLARLGTQVSASIGFFERYNGAFPFDHLDISQLPSSIGQSWPELVYLSTLAFLPSRAEEEAGITEGARRQSRELMPFHEVAHQWWGNVVDAQSYRDVWIEEGMAHYLALLYDDSRKPGDHHLDFWLDRYREALLARAAGTNEPVDDAGPLILGYRVDSSKTPGAYATIIYGKGAWVMHMLREMLRDPAAADPDARFRDLLRSVLSEYRFRALSTGEFERAVNQWMTPAMDLDGSHSMDWFFDEWVRNTGIPRYRVEYQVRARGAGFAVSGRLEQMNVGPLFTARVPIYAAAPGARSLLFLGSVVTTGAETSFEFTSRVRPARLVIDPGRTVLCRAN